MEALPAIITAMPGPLDDRVRGVRAPGRAGLALAALVAGVLLAAALLASVYRFLAARAEREAARASMAQPAPSAPPASSPLQGLKTGAQSDPPAAPISPEDAAVRAAYTAFETALFDGDLPQLKLLTAKEQRAELEPADAPVKLELARAMVPRETTVTGVVVTGETAVLSAEARGRDQLAKGRIELVLEDGRWKVAKIDWQLTLTDEAVDEAKPKPLRDVARPADWPQLLGTWRGKETTGPREWTITFGDRYRFDAQSDAGELYGGEALIRWDLGVEEGVIHVPPGWGPLDVEIDVSNWKEAVSQVGLAAFSLTQGELRLCGGAPGSTRRVRSFETPGAGFRCMVLKKVEAGTAP